MTAFARVSTPHRQGGWVVEFRSVNHRYFEFSVKLSPSLFPLEGRIRDLVQANISRGKVTVAVTQENGEEGIEELALDEKAVKIYLRAIHKLSRRFKLREEVSIGDLLSLPRLFTVKRPGQDAEKTWPLLKQILTKTMRLAVRSKETEGRKLASDITGRLRKIGQVLHKIEGHVAGSTDRYYEKLIEKIDQLFAEKDKDLDRFHREAAFLAERTDITEEIVRMKSHLQLFGGRLKSGTEVGRELDFLCQEMNREVNTMGSKAQFFEISTLVVFIKGELEKIREQLQNIE